MSEQTIDLGRDADGNGHPAVIFSRPEMVPLVIAIASLLFNNQLPVDVIAMLLGLAVDAFSNGQISQLNAALALAVSSNGQILQLNAAYDNYTAVIYTSLTIYFMIQVPIFAAIFAAQPRSGCQICWSSIIVSGLTSATIIVALFLIFFFQFNLRSRRRQLRRQLRGQLGKEGLSVISTSNPNRLIIAPDPAEDDEDLDINWVAKRAAFLVILMVISVCFLVSFTSVLCPHVP